MFLDTNIENYYITMVNPTIHARCLIRNKKEKKRRILLSASFGKELGERVFFFIREIH